MKQLVLLFILFPFFLFSQGQHDLDSLLNVLKIEKIDTSRVKLLNTVSQFFLHMGEYSKCVEKSDECLALIESRLNSNKKLTDREKEIFLIAKAESFSAKGMSYSDQGNYLKAKEMLLKALKLHTDIKNKKGQSRANNNLGLIEFEGGKYAESLKYHDASMRLNDEIGNVSGMASSLNNIGNVYSTLGNFKKARENYEKALVIYIQMDKKIGIGNAYNNIGFTCEDEMKYDSAIYYFQKGLKIRLEIGDRRGEAGSYSSIGNIYFIQKKFQESIPYFEKALSIKEEIGDAAGSGSQYLNLASIYSSVGKNDLAISIGEKGLKILKGVNSIVELKTAYETLSKIYAAVDNYNKAYDYHLEFSSLKDSMFNETNSKIMHELNTKYDTEKKEQQNQLLQTKNQLSEKTIKQQRVVSFVIIISLLIVSALAFFIFRGLKQQRKANAIIELQKQEVEKQKELVEEHQKEILDSIHYAKRIQNTLLAHHEFLNENLPNNFVLFNPKDIVSGDFYWATKHGDNFYLAVCDSTGHGVPGAFMSLLNIGFLNEAINEKDILEPHEVFNHVRKRLISSISKEGQKDGFDGILLRINQRTKEITYAAAHNAPILISDSVIIELEKDKMPVGQGEWSQGFSLFKINAKQGDLLYLYTDGYADQFGGTKGKKFKYKPLNELLFSVSSKQLKEQSEILQNTFNEWKGHLEQVDDVCIIGIKIDV